MQSGATTTGAPPRRTRRRQADGAAAWGLLTPALLLSTLFLALPFALAIGLSFTDARLNSPLPTSWVGLGNYRALIVGDGGAAPFLRAFGNNALFAAVVVPLQTALALALALLLDRPLRGMAAFRAVFFMPVVYPMALVSVIWMLLYAPDGLLNAVFAAIGWAPVGGSVLDDPALALPAIMALSIWQGVGFQTVILLAGLQQVPRELHEAAAVDGAGAPSRFVHVTLPSLRGPLLFTALVTTILSFRLFDQVRILTPDGGPDGSTATMIFLAVRASGENLGLASAMTVAFFVVVCAVALLQRRLLRDPEGA